jgi:peroxiredoxin
MTHYLAHQKISVTNFRQKYKPLTSVKLALKLMLISIVLVITQNAWATKNIPVGPNIGDIAPAISVINNQNQATTLNSLMGEKGLILVFFRSADWCSYCKKHLIALNKDLQNFATLGYGLAGISYDSLEVLNQFVNQHAIKYPLLADTQAQTMAAYGILNKAYTKGDDNYGIPYPGIVIVNKKGKVIHKYFYEGYKNRVDFTKLYEKLSQEN